MWFWATCQEQGIKEKEGGREVKGGRHKKKSLRKKGETRSKLADEERGKCDVKDRKVGKKGNEGHKKAGVAKNERKGKRKGHIGRKTECIPH